jgi:hypothetical protein
MFRSISKISLKLRPSPGVQLDEVTYEEVLRISLHWKPIYDGQFPGHREIQCFCCCLRGRPAEAGVVDSAVRKPINELKIRLDNNNLILL